MTIGDEIVARLKQLAADLCDGKPIKAMRVWRDGQGNIHRDKMDDWQPVKREPPSA